MEDSALVDGTVAFVNKFQSFFTLNKSSTFSEIPAVIVGTDSGSGNWHRVPTPSKKWASQSVWYLDSVAGDDENDGSTASTALLTHSELMRRFAGSIINSYPTVNILNSMASEDININLEVGPYNGEIGGAAGIYYLGIPSVVFTGTITSVTNINAATNQDGLIIDSALPVSWTASGGVGKLVRITGGDRAGTEFWIISDQGSKTARISQPVATPFLEDLVNLQVGDPYEVLSFPQFGNLVNISITGSTGKQVNLQYLEVGSSLNSHSIEVVLGGVINSSCLMNAFDVTPPGYGQLYNCRVSGGHRCEPNSAGNIMFGGISSGLSCRTGASIALYNASFDPSGGTGIIVGVNAAVDIGNNAYVALYNCDQGIQISSGGRCNDSQGSIFGKTINNGIVIFSGGLMLYTNAHKPSFTTSGYNVIVGGTNRSWAQLPFIEANGAAMVFKDSSIHFVNEEYLILDTSIVNNADGRTGVYTESVLTYTSTIDPALTTLTADVCYDNGCAANAVSNGNKLPILVLMHGYSQNRTYISQAFKRRAADAGFLVVAPNMRGRGGDPGSADDARDRYDIWDAIISAESLYPTVGDINRKYIMGYSGGGGDTIAMATKFPGQFIVQTAFFGWGDVGYNPNPDKSYWGSKDNRQEVINRVGPRINLESYRARSSIGNIAQAVSQSTGQLYLFWDSEDPVGRAMRDVRDALIAGGAPKTRWLANESTPQDAIRWLHNYPDNVPNLILAEQPLYRMRELSAPEVQHTGVYDVAGYLVHGAGFEIWTADTGTDDARLNSSGGTKYNVRVEFDTGLSRYVVTPKSGACAVTVRQHRVATLKGAPLLTFTEMGGTGDTITRTSSGFGVGSFYDDGFQIGDIITVRTPLNNFSGEIALMTSTVLTLGSTDVVTEGPVAGSITAEKLIRQLTKDISTETVFDLGNTLLAIIPDAHHLYEAHQGVSYTSTVSSWTELTGNGGPAIPPGTAPTFNTADPYYPSVEFQGTGTRLRADGSSLVNGSGDFTVVVRFHATETQSLQSAFSYSDVNGVTNQWLHCFANETNFGATLSTSVTDYTVNFNGYNPYVLNWNLMIVWRSGNTLWLQVNAEAPVSVAISGTATLTRLNLGELDRLPGFSELFGLDGAVSHLLSATRVLTQQERMDIYWFFRQLGVSS